MPNNYTYLFGSILTILVWLFLFLKRKDVRKEMLILSFMMGVSGLLLEYFIWTNDWWRPQTLTNTTVGIEDFLFGFGTGGIAAVVYEEIFEKRLCRIKKKKSLNISHLTFLIILPIAIGTICFYYLGLNSFVTSILSMFIPTLVIWYLRKDLVVDSICTSVILLVMTFVGFWFLNLVEPGFVYRWWLFQYLSGIIILGVPLEDVIWFSVAGLFIAPLYEFWQCMRFKNR